ncbi:MAG: hypothetical protein SCALA702_12580 [Melioribacteraceae bacterium]|nr:MAG: hypothetical protein SCALA702_12580 [Melioribacteraceae bacterium]
MNLGWRTKLYIFSALIAIIPLAVSSINMINLTEEELKSNVNQELIITTGQLAEEINSFYTESWNSPLMVLKKSLESGALGIEEITAIATGVVSNSPEIYRLEFYVDGGGGNLISALSFNKGTLIELAESYDASISDVLAFDEGFVERSEQMKVGFPRYIKEIESWVIPTVMNLDIPGIPNAALASYISLNSIKSEITNHVYNENGRIFLVNEYQMAVFSEPGSRKIDNQLAVEAVELLKANRRIQSVNGYVTSDGKSVVGSYAFPENLNWVVIAEIDEDVAYQTVAKMEQALFLWVGLGVLIAVVIVLFYSRQIGGPIKKITAMASEVSGGNFDVKSEYRARDEIGFLGRTLEDMSKSLKESFAKIERQNKELEEYNRTLEDKVEQRTIELKQKNTELEALLKKLKATQDQLVMQEKLASLGALTAGIAHEIQNPLNFVNNFSKLSVGLVEELNEEIEDFGDKLTDEDRDIIDEIMDDIKMNVEKINHHGKRAESIVKNMLQHSRSDGGQFMETNIPELVDEAINLAYHAVKSKDKEFNVSFDKNYDPAIKKARVNSQALNRVVLNVVNNSLYAMRQKFTADSSYKPVFTANIKAVDDKFSIELRDNGPGIPKKVYDKIFEPFFTTKPTGEGTGLGLSLSYDIITQMHKGELKVDTAENEFTQFTITIPLNEA